jgi:peptidoglycan/xylan/chitin deacetylase (PgdA/CDA1 family)
MSIMTSPVWFSSWMHGTAQSAPQTAAENPCRNGYYALTFDDGPYPGHTEELVKMLKKLHVRAVFFNVGRRAHHNPTLVALQRTVGQVENHSWNHKNYIHFKTTAHIVRNIKKAQRVLGGKSIYMRPPYGGTNAMVRRAIAQAGLVETMWTVDTDDWSKPYTHRKILQHTEGVRDGDIILLHDGWPYTIYTLPEIVDQMKAKGLCSGKLVVTSGLTSRMPGKDKDQYHSYPFRVRAGKP